MLEDWADGFVDRDGKFVKEFQTTFHSSFWELYLHAVLKHLKCDIDFSKQAPDFIVEAPTKFSVEAVVALHATGTETAEQAGLKFIPSNLNEFNRQAIIRLANSVHSKSKKYLSSYGSKPHVSDRPFVIAVAAFDRPHFPLQCQRAIEALLFNYYVDEEAFLSGANKTLEKSRIAKVAKDSGAEIPLGMFMDDSFAHVSAVVFSMTGTWGKVRSMAAGDTTNSMFTTVHYNPKDGESTVRRAHKPEYSETILDGLRVYHNPHAAIPLDLGLFRSEEVFQSYWDELENDWGYEFSEKNLLCRQINTTVKRLVT